MDLLERGRSLSELGRTLRWSDLKAMLIHLPDTAHVRRVLAPEAARLAEWMTPTNILLGALYDAWEVDALIRKGVPDEQLPTRGVLDRIINPDPKRVEAAPARSSVGEREKKAREAAARIRSGL